MNYLLRLVMSFTLNGNPFLSEDKSFVCDAIADPTLTIDPVELLSLKDKL